MFDLLIRQSIDDVPVPLPGRVLLFCDAGGALRARLSDGSVATLEAGPVGAQGPQGPQGMPGVDGATGPQGPQGLKGDVLVDALDVGAFAFLGANIPALENKAVGEVVTSNGANLFYQLNASTSVGAVTPYLPAGQAWRYMGGRISSTGLYQRVA